MMPVRCKACGRADLPVVPGTRGGNGEIATPVAHVRISDSLITTRDDGAKVGIGVPCWQGGSKQEIIMLTQTLKPHVDRVQAENFEGMDL